VVAGSSIAEDEAGVPIVEMQHVGRRICVMAATAAQNAAKR
jgi:hypothetical protein